MKVLVVYGGVNRGLKKDLVDADILRSGRVQKLHDLNNLTVNIQYYVRKVRELTRTSQAAAVDGIEVVQRHYQDLKDYLYEPEPSVIDKGDLSEVKQLFAGKRATD